MCAFADSLSIPPRWPLEGSQEGPNLRRLHDGSMGPDSAHTRAPRAWGPTIIGIKTYGKPFDGLLNQGIWSASFL
jgi:hypothetical protein